MVEEVLGEEFDGVLVSDFYGAYNVYQGPHQRCWVHLLRAMHQLKERYPQEAAVAAWTQGVREVYDRAQAYPGSDPRLPGVVQQAQRVKQQREYEQELWALCQPHVKTQAPMRVLCQRVERFLSELFTFVAEPQVTADNNAAERSLRPPVVSRSRTRRNLRPGTTGHASRPADHRRCPCPRGPDTAGPLPTGPFDRNALPALPFLAIS